MKQTFIEFIYVKAHRECDSRPTWAHLVSERLSANLTQVDYISGNNTRAIGYCLKM